MKKTIDGVEFNTKHAKEITHCDAVDDKTSTSLYRTKKGRYFLHIQKLQIRRGGVWRDTLMDGSAHQFATRQKRFVGTIKPLSEGGEVDWYIENLVPEGLVTAIRDRIDKSPKDTLMQFLTPNSVAVVERMVRDHGLSVEEIIKTAVDDNLYHCEKDIAKHGWVSSGELEWGLVQLAATRRTNWGFCGNSKHKVGSVSFYKEFDHKHIANLRKTMELAA